MIKRLIIISLFSLTLFSKILARTITIGKETTETIIFEEKEYLPLSKVLDGLSAKGWLVDDRLIMILPYESIPRNEIIIFLNRSEVKVGFEVMKVPYPAIKIAGDIYLPLFSLQKILNQFIKEISEASVDTLLPTEVLKTVDLIPEIQKINVQLKSDTTVIVFKLSSDVYFSTKTTSYTHYEINFQARTEIKDIPKKGVLKGVEIKRENGTKITFHFKIPCDVRVNKVAKDVILKFLPRVNEKVRLIVLDPGHGGKDPGAVGKMNTKEKDLNLAIARRIKKRLEKLGYNVLLTRNSDIFLPLAERAKFANDNKADIFVSIHCNAAPPKNRHALGFEVFFLSEARTDWERAVAQRENAALQYELPPNLAADEGFLSSILADLAQNQFLKESQDLAVEIQDAVCEALELENRGVKQAGFYVLRGTFMPSVLIECGFLSNRREEKLLRQERYQEKLAEAIVKGIRKYLNKLESSSK